LPAGFNYLLADSAKAMTVKEWERLGVARVGGKGYPRPADRAYLLIPAGAAGPAFLMLNNFRVLMKYNPAEAYALAIGHLADRLRGDGPIVTAWPRHERVLTSAERCFSGIWSRGFDIRRANGRINARSRASRGSGIRACCRTASPRPACSEICASNSRRVGFRRLHFWLGNRLREILLVGRDLQSTPSLYKPE
jgi:hypothetical protein